MSRLPFQCGTAPLLPISARELAVDLFCGGGGSSLGMERATGRPVDVAINHDIASIEMHRANHPCTRHLLEDVWRVAPREALDGRPVGLLSASPNCTHFSRAKGGRPVDRKNRSLGWVIVRWAREVRPRVIVCENVPEWTSWTALVDGRPNPATKGRTFRMWVGRLRALGYEVDWRVIDAADLGEAQRRRRLFVVARCDGAPIVWPKAMYGPTRATPWRGAYEIIDWSLPCPSIFERKRPLAEATMRRIARGLQRFVIESPEPFVVSFYGERDGQAPRFHHLDQPLPAVVTDPKHALVVPHISQFFGGMVGKSMTDPLPTVTATDHHGFVAAWLEKFYGTAGGADARMPLPTVTASGNHIAEVRAFLLKWYGSCAHGQSVRDPLHTITTKARFGLVTIHGVDYQIVDIGLRMLSPRELARAQGFPESYRLVGSQRDQIARIGNAVVPRCMEAIVRANLPCATAEAVSA